MTDRERINVIAKILLLHFLFTKAFTEQSTFVVSRNAPIGWLVADLRYSLLVSDDELLLSILPSPYYRRFTINELGQVVTAATLPKSITRLPLYILATREDANQRVISIHVEVTDRLYRFYQDHYQTTVSEKIDNGSILMFSMPITIKGPSNQHRLQFVPLTSITEFPIVIINRQDPKGRSFAQIQLTENLTARRHDIMEFYLGAFDEIGREMGNCKVTIVVEEAAAHQPPQFDVSHYFTTLPELPPASIVMTVHARDKKSTVIYYLKHDNSSFNVSPFSGEIYTTTAVQPGKYSFEVVAKNSIGQESTATVTVIIENEQSNSIISNRYRRELSDPIVIKLKENTVREYRKLIPLFVGEKIINAPIVREHFTIFPDGSVVVTKPLNFEKTHELREMIYVEGRKKSRIQNLRIEVEGVDEPPAFINGPVPFLAVVPLETPVGFHVYKFAARDEGGDGDDDVEYRLINSEPSGMFTVDVDTGVVRTAIRQYQEGQTYRVQVQAIDKTPTDNTTKLESEVAKLEILAGDRPPQFLQQYYSVSLPEDSLVDYSVVDVRANRFRSIDDRRTKGELIYSLWNHHHHHHGVGGVGQREESMMFGIDPKSGVVHLRRLLDYDDPSQPKLYKLIVVASEDGKESSVPLDVHIIDVNDNAPIFSRPLYNTQVKEDFPVGKPILTVRTEDKDSGENAKVRYVVDNDNFTVNDKGEISAKNRLDADQFKERFFIYRFNVTAIDYGNPPLSSNATVHIRTENTNDEAPVFFPTRQYTAYVAEDAQGGTPVVQIQARDPDRDQVEYAFIDDDGSETYETSLFQIDKDTGLIKLRPGVYVAELLQNSSPYNLTVIARDDGSCCASESVRHSALATVLIGVEDVNNNKPEFRDCASYGEMAKIQEGVYKKDPPVIIKVEATDEDSSANGQIVYSLYYAQSESRKPFIIDKLTGILTPSPHVIFDRETRPREDVTVKATDRGDRPLIGFCQFSVEVVDVNDNAPQFDRASYETSVSRSETIGTSILTVFAFDTDAPHNANVTYHLEPDLSAGEEFLNDTSFFRILNEHSGEITLIKPIPRAKKEKFVFNVIANDNGIPEPQLSTVQVTIKVHEKQQLAPRWQSSPDCKNEVVVVENTEMNKVLLRCRAVAGDGSKSSVVYKLSNGGVIRPGKTDSKFRQFNKIENGRDWVEVVIMEPLDYEQAHNYTLTLTATDMNSHVSSSRSFTVLVHDVNDVVPQFTVDLFTGTVDEELTPAEYLEKFDKKPIVSVKAVDADSNGPQNEVHYRILDVPDPQAADLFRIDELTGEIWPNAKFDREQKDMYILTVEARDNLPSALPGASGPNKDNVKVQIVIGDVNDNAPSFDEAKYIGKVLEDADTGHDIITIKAHDMDKHSTLRYDVVAAQGGRIPFGARTDSGAIFVKEPLDYEQESVYHLRLLVSDGRHNASTDVFIYVEDVNDNAPIFDQPSYTITILEEDPDIPKILFHLHATDADKDEKSRRIIYLLEGQGTGEFFRIGRESGEIELVKALDRDPPDGVPTWNFIAQAIDDDGRGLIGYADVQVNLKDINDNAPIFADDLYGFIEENREPHSRDGIYFMDVRATDYDDPTTENARLEYNIVLNKEIDGIPVFRIDPSSGKIFAMRALDRELPSEREFVIEVRAIDHGTPPREGAANVTVKVLDKNDNPPSFERSLYEAIVDETIPIGSAVISVSATDPDDEAIDNLFTYTLVDDSNYFYMTTDRDSSESSVGVLRVKQPLDYEDQSQRDGFRLRIRVSDGLHDAVSSVFVQLLDQNDHPPDIIGPSEVRIAEDVPRGTFVARFSVSDRDASDFARFRINRQSDPKRQFTIDQDGTLRVAQRLDREDISSYKLIIEAFDAAGNVGTQLVAVYLRDVNDNGPEPYTVPKFCIFPENTPVNQQGTCEIRCTDKDSPEYGPPFNMQLDQSKWKYGDYLSVTFDSHGDGGNGSMTIRPLVVFDREAANPGKILEIPLILTDRADRTNHASVHVIIGDENDNPMHDGKMVITVNSYLGKLKRTQIGRVYVEDLDDWDLGDKTFTWKNSLPGFELSPRGEITMDANMPPGTYQISSNVHDNRRSENAVGYVTVNVILVPELAFINQGSMQLLLADGSNLQSPEDFIRVNDSGKSIMKTFTQQMVKYMGGNVVLDIFSIQLDYATLQTRTVPVLNIRFSAHGSPYRDSVQLNGLISSNRDELQSKLGVTIVGVGIDMCKFTICDSGCQTINTADFNGVVVSANSTVLVGVNSQSRDECTCPVWRPPTQCQAGLCHNDGVCHNTHPGFFCECRNDLLKGSRCQGTTRSFSGDGFAWYKPMPACTSLNISMQFMTLQPDAILFYNGPMDTKTSEEQIEYRDYIIIHLRAGRLVMEMSMNGIAPVNLEVASSPLNDGTWHELAVTQIGKYIEMVVDQCRYLGTRSDDSACRESLFTPDDDERLNIVAPVQIGGISPLSNGQSYPLAVPRTPLNGCVRNLRVNDDQYDLATPSYERNSASGCLLWGGACDSNAIDSLTHCVHGDCYADLQGSTSLIPKCICDPGWGGPRCEKKIGWIQMQSGGFIDYLPKIAFPEQTNDIELLFIPGRVTGAAELTYGSDKLQNYVSTSVEMTSDGLTPMAKFDIGGVRNSLTQLRIPSISLKENSSYWMHFTRNPTRTSLSIDNAYYTSQVLDPTVSPQSFALQVSELFLGTHSGGRGFQGCIGTYRWSNQNLPLRQSLNNAIDQDDESIVSIIKWDGVSDDCNLLITCAQLPVGYCSGAMVCVDFWKGAFCTCPEGANAMLGDDGQLVGCGETLAVAKLGISNPAIILILVSLVLLIMLVMLMLVYARRQTSPFESVRPEDLNRDNLRPYAIEGGGEADNDQYSIANLRKPVMPIEGNGLSLGPPAPVYARPPIDERLRSQLNDLESDQNAAPFDEIRIYEDEKDTVSVVTLESLGSIPDTERQPETWEQRFPS